MANPRTKALTIEQLSQEQLTDGLAYIQESRGGGEVDSWKLKDYQVSRSALLVTTQSFTAVKVASHLVNDKKQLPQIIIIDDGKQAAQLWQKLRTFFDKHTSLPSDFEINRFVETNLNLMPPTKQSTNSHNLLPDAEYIKEIIVTCGYDAVRKVVLESIYVQQKWTDTATFIQLKNYIDDMQYENVFVYNYDQVSRAIKLPEEEKAKLTDASLQIVTNISKLKPTLTIHGIFQDCFGCVSEFYYDRGEKLSADIVKGIVDKRNYELIIGGRGHGRHRIIRPGVYEALSPPPRSLPSNPVIPLRDLRDTGRTHSDTPSTLREETPPDYSWIWLLTTTLSTLATIGLLTTPFLYFPALVTSLGWPVFLAVVSGCSVLGGLMGFVLGSAIVHDLKYKAEIVALNSIDTDVPPSASTQLHQTFSTTRANNNAGPAETKDNDCSPLLGRTAVNKSNTVHSFQYNPADRSHLTSDSELNDTSQITGSGLRK